MSETPTTNPNFSTSTSDNDRVKASLENWKRKLLDLTKRNRALNFKVNKVSTITIIDEQPAEVFRQLYLREQSMRFQAAPEPDSEEQQGVSTDERLTPNNSTPLFANGTDDSSVEESSIVTFDEEDEDDALHSDFVPYDSASLEERHTDNQLQTTAQAEALDKSLRRLDEQARMSIEEQGVNPLFLAIGMLHYTESVIHTRSSRRL